MGWCSAAWLWLGMLVPEREPLCVLGQPQPLLTCPVPTGMAWSPTTHLTSHNEATPSLCAGSQASHCSPASLLPAQKLEQLPAASRRRLQGATCMSLLL